MTTANLALNKRACELLGICWHEAIANNDKYYEATHEGWRCSCGRSVPCINRNPDFTTDPGKVELLRLMMQREDWRNFRDGYLCVHGDYIPCKLITDTTGLLLKAAVEWMESQLTKGE
jgi:hypothetical protein